jgi:hypothetical protein
LRPTVGAASRSATPARRAVCQPELHLGAAVRRLPQPPAAALIDAGDAVPCHLAAVVELDDLHEPADVRRADLHAHHVARSEPTLDVALDLEPRHAVHQPAVHVGIGHERPHPIRRHGNGDLAIDAHHVTR